MGSIKKIFGAVAMSVGGGGTLWAGSGLLLGGWSTAGAPGGVDLTGLGVAFTAVSAGIAYAGYRALTSDKAPEQKPTADDQPKP